MMGKHVGNRFVAGRPSWSVMEAQRELWPRLRALAPIIRATLVVQGRLENEVHRP